LLRRRRQRRELKRRRKALVTVADEALLVLPALLGDDATDADAAIRTARERAMQDSIPDERRVELLRDQLRSYPALSTLLRQRYPEGMNPKTWTSSEVAHLAIARMAVAQLPDLLGSDPQAQVLEARLQRAVQARDTAAAEATLLSHPITRELLEREGEIVDRESFIGQWATRWG
jgi:hypothetical protein